MENFIVYNIGEKYARMLVHSNDNNLLSLLH